MRIVYAIALSLAATAAQAADLAITLTPIAKFDSGFNSVPLDLTTAGIFQMQIDFSISNFGPDERNFGNIAFNTEITGPAAPLAGGAAYVPTTREFDLNGGLPGGEVDAFETNLDAGTPGDLQGILASLAGGLTDSDPRSSAGESGFEDIGSFFIDWDGMAQSTVQLVDVEFGVVLESTGLIGAPTASASSNVVVLGTTTIEIPEPATFGLASLGMFAFAGLRRRR